MRRNRRLFEDIEEDITDGPFDEESEAEDETPEYPGGKKTFPEFGDDFGDLILAGELEDDDNVDSSRIEYDGTNDKNDGYFTNRDYVKYQSKKVKSDREEFIKKLNKLKWEKDEARKVADEERKERFENSKRHRINDKSIDAIIKAEGLDKIIKREGKYDESVDSGNLVTINHVPIWAINSMMSGKRGNLLKEDVDELRSFMRRNHFSSLVTPINGTFRAHDTHSIFGGIAPTQSCVFRKSAGYRPVRESIGRFNRNVSSFDDFGHNEMLDPDEDMEEILDLIHSGVKLRRCGDKYCIER